MANAHRIIQDILPGYCSTADLTRRRFLKLGAQAGAAVALAPLRRAHAAALQRRLALHNTHTGENLSVVYRVGEQYVAESLASVDRLLRDHRTDEVFAIDVRLLDLLHALASSLQASAPFHVISGYRSPATNAALAARSEGVATHSLHTQGMAIDIRLPGLELPELRAAAVELRGGGVGYYARSDFVHVDVGRVRYW